MLLSRDYVGYMAKEIVKRLVAGKMIETKHVENLTQQVRQVMAEEVTIEDRLNEEVREILARIPTKCSAPAPRIRKCTRR